MDIRIRSQRHSGIIENDLRTNVDVLGSAQGCPLGHVKLLVVATETPGRDERDFVQSYEPQRRGIVADAPRGGRRRHIVIQHLVRRTWVFGAPYKQESTTGLALRPYQLRGANVCLPPGAGGRPRGARKHLYADSRDAE